MRFTDFNGCHVVHRDMKFLGIGLFPSFVSLRIIRKKSDASEHRLHLRICHKKFPRQAAAIILDHHSDGGLIQSHING